MLILLACQKEEESYQKFLFSALGPTSQSIEVYTLRIAWVFGIATSCLHANNLLPLTSGERTTNFRKVSLTRAMLAGRGGWPTTMVQQPVKARQRQQLQACTRLNRTHLYCTVIILIIGHHGPWRFQCPFQ